MRKAFTWKGPMPERRRTREWPLAVLSVTILIAIAYTAAQALGWT